MNHEFYEFPKEPEHKGNKKNRVRLILAIVCLAVILLCSILLIWDSAVKRGRTSTPADTGSDTEREQTESQSLPPETETSNATDTTGLPPESESESVTEPPEREYVYHTDVTAVLSYIDTKDPQYLVLANRSHPLTPAYAPDDLVTMAHYSALTLRECANIAYEAMMAEAKALGMADSHASSAYRSYEVQEKLYTKYLADERAAHPDYTEEQLMALVDLYSARAGTSDHQTGLTVDFWPIEESFENTKLFQFLMENGYKFGFILRFPEGKTDITGYMYESWHWRFVGREAATYIYENRLTLEEYLAIIEGE